MQSETATSRPVPPSSESDETYESSLILVHSHYYVKTWCHPQNRKYITYRTVVRGGPSHGHSNMYRTFGEIWTSGFWDMRANRQTNRQTYRLTDRQTDIQTRRSLLVRLRITTGDRSNHVRNSIYHSKALSVLISKVAPATLNPVNTSYNVEPTGSKVGSCFNNVALTLLLVWTGL